MAKRFTDTNKYKKSFIRSLPGAYKLLWDFLYHDCDHAGIWIVDFQIAQMFVGEDMKIKKEMALELFNADPDDQKIIVVDGGKKWFIPGFIDFQYGQLSEKNAAHKNVVKALKKYRLINDDLKPLYSPFNGAKEKEEEKEEEMEEEMEEEIGGVGERDQDEKFLVPVMLQTWKKHKPQYPANSARDFPPLQAIAVFICEAMGLNYQARDGDTNKRILSEWDAMAAKAASDNHYRKLNLISIEKHIQSLYEQTKNATDHNGASKNSNGVKLGTSEARVKTARDW